MTQLTQRIRDRLAAVAIMGVVLALTGCDDRPRAPRVVSIPTIDVKRSSAKEVRDAATLNGVVAAANLVEPPPPPAAPPAPAAPKVTISVANQQVYADGVIAPPFLRDRITASRTAGIQPAIRLPGIRSPKPHTSRDAALEDALNEARYKLMRELQTLDSPIFARPSKVTMKAEYIKGEVREILPTDEQRKEFLASGVRGDLRWVEVDLELSEDHVQRLRASDRVTDGFRGAAAIFIFILAVYGFLRLDEWTKGYLTTWLGVGAIGLIVVGVLVFIA